MKNIPKDMAHLFRNDLQIGVPPDIVLMALTPHLQGLRELPDNTPYKQKAIADCEKLLTELKGK